MRIFYSVIISFFVHLLLIVAALFLESSSHVLKLPRVFKRVQEIEVISIHQSPINPSPTTPLFLQKKNVIKLAEQNPSTPPSPQASASKVDSTPAADWSEYKPVPKYPIWAQNKNIEGEILVLVEADETGRVKNLKIQKSTGYAVLDEAAVAALKDWRLQANVIIQVPFEFRLTDKK